VYLKDSSSLLAAIRQAVTRGEATALYHSAHRLKGSSASLGANTLADLCAHLEELGQAGNVAEAPEWLSRVEAEYKRVCRALEAERR
ncbi:MAG: Hpt domain-containing protein, partial [Anaerolineales bacterium]